MRIVLFNVPGERPRSVLLMWNENVDPATLIGIDRLAGVRMVDGTLNDSCCQVGYLRISEQETDKHATYAELTEIC